MLSKPNIVPTFLIFGDRLISKAKARKSDGFFSLPCLVNPSVLLLSFVKIVEFVRWISLSCYIDFSKLIHEIFDVVTWICQTFSMYVFKLLHVFSPLASPKPS